MKTAWILWPVYVVTQLGFWVYFGVLARRSDFFQTTVSIDDGTVYLSYLCCGLSLLICSLLLVQKGRFRRVL